MKNEGNKAVVIAVTNQKGGVGKTTTAVNVAYNLAKNHKARVLLVDFDPQGNATSSVGVDKTATETTVLDVIDESVAMKDAILETEFKNLWLVSSTPELADAEPGLAKAENKFVRLKKAIASVESEYDYVIIDSPPSLSMLTLNALVAANYLLLPVQAEYFALEGLGQLLQTLKIVKEKKMNARLNIIGVAVTMVDSRNTLSKQVDEQIKKYFPGKVFETSIPRNVRVAEAPSHGVPVGAYDKRSKGAKAYRKLTEELVNRIEEK